MIPEPWLQVAALRMVSDRAGTAYDAARVHVERLITRGSRMVVEAPDGTKLGTVSRSKPGNTAQVTGPNAFTAWAKERYPDDIEFELDIVGTDEQVKAALHESHPELVKLRETVSQSLRTRVIEASARYGAPAGPDGELDVRGISVTPSAESKISFLPAAGAYDVIAELIRTGKLTLPDFLDAPVAAVDGN